MKSVHFVHFSDKPGGIEVLLPVIANGISKFSFSAFVLRPKSINTLSVYDGLPININYGSLNTFVAFFKLINYIRSHKKDIFHLYNTGPLFLLAFKICRIQNIVYSIHGTIYWKTHKQMLLRKPLWFIALCQKIKFTSNSNYSAKMFMEKISEKHQIQTLYNPFDISKFNSTNRIIKNKDAIKIIYVGRLAKGKNLHAWIDVFENLVAQNLKIEGEIYGNGPLKEELELIIEKKNITKQLKLMGHSKNIESVYKNADLLLFLSEYESFGNVVVESILCGTPVLTFNIPSMLEIFENYPDFLINKKDNYKEEIINKVFKLTTLKEATKKAAIEFSKRFNSTKHLAELETIYEKFN